jgi:hypothetical protein
MKQRAFRLQQPVLTVAMVGLYGCDGRSVLTAETASNSGILTAPATEKEGS